MPVTNKQSTLLGAIGPALSEVGLEASLPARPKVMEIDCSTVACGQPEWIFGSKCHTRTVLDELRVTQGGPAASPPQNVRKWPYNRSIVQYKAEKPRESSRELETAGGRSTSSRPSAEHLTQTPVQKPPPLPPLPLPPKPCDLWPKSLFHTYGTGLEVSGLNTEAKAVGGPTYKLRIAGRLQQRLSRKLYVMQPTLGQGSRQAGFRGRLCCSSLHCISKANPKYCARSRVCLHITCVCQVFRTPPGRQAHICDMLQSGRLPGFGP